LNQRGIGAVVFDFDYTLADSSAGIVQCANYAMQRLGLPVPPSEKICATIGMSLPETFAALTGNHEADAADRFMKLFVEHADEVMNANTFLFDHVPETMEALRSEGLLLGIVSSKYRYRIEAILGAAGLRDHFEIVIGGEDVKAFKPDPAGLLAAADRLGAGASGTLYVGDSVTDAETALRASVPFAAVLSGVTAPERFQTFNPLAVLPDVSHVGALLQSLR
jgi:phosphoglycolate phosphatase